MHCVFDGKPDVYFCGTSMDDCCVEHGKLQLAPRGRLSAETLQATSPAPQPNESLEVPQAAPTHVLTRAAGSRCAARNGNTPLKLKTR